MTPVVAGLQRWLALEHEAVWLHPVIGARFDELSGRARSAYATHRAVRDELLVSLRALDATPVATELTYDLGPLRTKAQAAGRARQVERAIAAACLALAGVSDGDDRTRAIRGLRRAALAELTWGGRAEAFPGLP